MKPKAKRIPSVHSFHDDEQGQVIPMRWKHDRDAYAIADIGGPITVAIFGALCAAGAVLVGILLPTLRKVY